MSRMKIDQLADAFVQAVTPDDDVRTIRRVTGLVQPNGKVSAQRVPIVFPWQSRDFVLPGVLTIGANRGGIFQVPQGGTVRRLAVRARTAPGTGAAEFTITINGVNSTPPLRISLPVGEFAADAVADYQLPPMSNVALIVSASNGAADVTITLHIEPGVTNE